MADNRGVKTTPSLSSPAGQSAGDRDALPPTQGAVAVRALIADAGGWVPFDLFMHHALYAPNWGYYATPRRLIGTGFGDGSDFVTAPELSPVFAQTLARAVAEWMAHTGVDEIWEFGAGRGVLARDLLKALDALGCGPRQGRVRRYVIVEVSGALRAVQSQTLAEYPSVVTWADAWPEGLSAVVLGNEVLDAMPVQLLYRHEGQWFERGVSIQNETLVWRDCPTDLRPPVPIAGEHDYLTEIHPQAHAWVQDLGRRLTRGVLALFDYGFPEAEYYHPQRSGGTVMCHQGHLSDPDPLESVGEKDITAHVDFTGIALAAQEARLAVVGYSSQGSFLLDAGLVDVLPQASVAQQAAALKLIHEHEMGELFKVIVLAPEAAAADVPAIGFVRGDRTHTL